MCLTDVNVIVFFPSLSFLTTEILHCFQYSLASPINPHYRTRINVPD